MKKRTKHIILLVVGLQVALIVGLLALPSVVQAIPGRYRVALAERNPFLSNIAEGVIDQVAPVATALPAPSTAGNPVEAVDIAALIGNTPTAVPTTPPTPTIEPTVVPEEAAEAASETATEPTQTAVPPTPAPTQTPTPEPLPVSVILEGVDVIRQSFNNCGPANLTQVLNYYGSDITQADVAAYLKPNTEDRNVSPWQIADYVNEQTAGQFRASAHSGGNLEMVKQFVAAGYPVVIEKGYELPDTGWWGHYLTIFGYDDEEQIFYSQDSFLGPWDGSGRIDSYEDIQFFWEQFNYTFYVVYLPTQETEVKAILGEEMLEPMAMWRKVASMAEQATIEKPDYAFAWFNLGTALTRMGELTGEQAYYQGGAQAFDQAREIGLPPRMLWYQFRPYYDYAKVGRLQDVVDLANATLETQGGRNVEETYWHKGHALAGLGDIIGARDAYAQALEVNENFYPAQLSLDWINSVINGS